ncbi:MAG: L,D-transpeptidase [Nocardioidaceae bacterium]
MAQPAGQRRVPRTRPRYARITAAFGSILVTAISLLGGIGIIQVGGGAVAVAQTRHHHAPAIRLAGDIPTTPRSSRNTGDSTNAATMAATPPGVPADSGTGRRIVFDLTAQRVWLVGQSRQGKDRADRTYLVSGSLTDNLKPGTYSVFSRSLHAIGIDNSGTMMYMVRFAHGAHAAIGFHDIPIKNGKLVQRRAALGTPRSHGCIRQARPDAIALWQFAPLGTKVVVTA